MDGSQIRIWDFRFLWWWVTSWSCFMVSEYSDAYDFSNDEWVFSWSWVFHGEYSHSYDCSYEEWVFSWWVSVLVVVSVLMVSESSRDRECSHGEYSHAYDCSYEEWVFSWWVSVFLVLSVPMVSVLMLMIVLMKNECSHGEWVFRSGSSGIWCCVICSDLEGPALSSAFQKSEIK
jgi:hypothetical protein